MAIDVQVVGPNEARRLLSIELANDIGQVRERDGPEALRLAVLRHAASRLCPCPRRLLVATAVTALLGILGDEAELVPQVSDAVDALIASGDLTSGIESAGGRPVLYLSPPLFVRRSPTKVYLVGGFPESDWPLSHAALVRDAYRQVSPAPSDDELKDLGIHPYPLDAWIEHPEPRSAEHLMAALDDRLERAGPPGALEELTIVDSAHRDYYVGRFVTPKRQTGRFVARRRRKWGAQAWSYVELSKGEPQRFVNFPEIDRRFRGCDEAWWTICAQDAMGGRAQKIGLSTHAGSVTISFYMPMPMWVERRLRAFGEPGLTPPGALFAFELPADEAGAEIEFLQEMLWLDPVR